MTFDRFQKKKLCWKEEEMFATFGTFKKIFILWLKTQITSTFIVGSWQKCLSRVPVTFASQFTTFLKTTSGNHRLLAPAQCFPHARKSHLQSYMHFLIFFLLMLLVSPWSQSRDTTPSKPIALNVKAPPLWAAAWKQKNLTWQRVSLWWLQIRVM